MTNGYRLITIPPSHFCEKARWALDHFDISYTEERHPPLLHYRPCRRAGGGRTAPVLATGVGAVADSSDILRFLDGRHGHGSDLYPAEPPLRGRVDELEELFDSTLGPHSRRLAYAHLLPHRRLFLGTVLDRVGPTERMLFSAAAPIMRGLMRRGLRITPDSTERSLGKVREIFAAVDDMLSDGRRYLVGDRFTAADLTFASLAAPAIIPRGYGSWLPPLDELPDSYLRVIDELRATPAGGFVLRLYRDER